MAESSAAWYTFDRIDNFGQIDPAGPYYKPDSNVLTPPGYQVTALLPGTITSVQRTSWGQTVVTLRLDAPLNSLATHMFYEHMHSASVQVGQHLSAGDQLGMTNLAGEGPNLGVGLYSGDVYGAGQDWTILQNDLRPGGAGLLNPTALLDAAKGGSLQLPNFSLPNLSSLTGWLQPLMSWLQHPTRILKIIVGLVLIGAAILLLIAPDFEAAAMKAVEV